VDKREQEIRNDMQLEQEPDPTQVVVVLDVDSTITGLEGIDELARMHGVLGDVAKLTSRAMAGELQFDEVFGLRLSMIRPRKEDLFHVGAHYVTHMIPHTKETISLLQKHGATVHLVSGGYRDAILLLSRHLGIDDNRVWANDLLFYEDGTYKGFDTTNPLCHNGGKVRIIRKIKETYPLAKIIAMVGDSVPDMRDTKDIANLRIAFGGYVLRPGVAREADIYIHQPSFAALIPILLPQNIIVQLLHNEDSRDFIIQGLRDVKSIISAGGANSRTNELICKVQLLVVS
jgi:phosphoserine phosphatase